MSGYQKEEIPIPTPGRLKRDLRLPVMPFWMKAALVIAITASWVPLALLLKARSSTSLHPRVQIFQDMGNQPRYSTQQPSPLFVDGRAMRMPVDGTVARGMLAGDDHYERGFSWTTNSATTAMEISYFKSFPEQVPVDEATMMRGRKLYNIYCATCHGVDGFGNGPTHQRAIEKQEPKWVPPSNLHTDDIRSRADGHLYNTIRNGIRNMPAYGSQIDTFDRWAIVAYVRALQRSQHAGVEDVPAEQRNTLK